jgi:hypothetical protein
MARWWLIAKDCLCLLAFAYVFTKLSTRLEFVTVAGLGLVYVATRTIAITQFLATVKMFADLNRQLLWVRKLLKDPTYDENQKDWDEFEKTEKPKREAIYYTHLGFLWLIGALCLIVLFIKL